MSAKSFAVPLMTVVFAAGASLATLEATANDTKELSTRVEKLESTSGKQEIVDLKIEGVETRLDKMEDIVGKILEMQQEQQVQMASICAATGATCR